MFTFETISIFQKTQEMKNITLLLLFFITNLAYSQSNYSNGFQSGYKNGYCHNKGVGCVSPNPPIAPLPSVNESLNSFQDGYNQGFSVGLNANKSTVNSDRQRYQTTTPTYVENKMSKININDIAKVASVLRQAKAKALELAQEGEYEESVEICKAGLKINPQDDEFMMFIGDIYDRFLEGDSIAIFYLEKAYQINKMPGLKTKINKIKNRIKENKEPVDVVDFKDNKESNFTIEDNIKEIESEMIKNFNIKNFVKALELGNKFNSLKPGIEANIFLADVNYELKDYPNAIKFYSLVLAQKEIPKIYFWRAMSKSHLNDYYGAISDYDYLIKLGNYDMATVYNNKAYSLVGLKKYKEALQYVNKALNLNSNIWYIWDTRGEINYNLNLYTECISDMKKAINLNPNENSYYFSGLAKIKLKQIANACKDFSKSGELGKSEAYLEIKKYCK